MYDLQNSQGRIGARLEQLIKKKQKGLITFITAGDPDINITEQLVLAMEKAGADIIELGVPFSDPMADGPIIQRASQRALAARTSLGDILKLVSRLRTKTQIPLVLMSYYNPIFQYGLSEFALKAAECGVDGVIIPDLPLEENKELFTEMKRCKLDLILLAAPTTTEERLINTGKSSQGFLYCVSITGVTGSQLSTDVDIQKFVGLVKKRTNCPIAIGFGISDTAQAVRMAELGDAIIVGSALVNLVEKNLEQPEIMIKEVSKFTQQLKEAINKNNQR